MQTIWFIRHGESTSNAGYPTRDPVTIGLTARGLEQSQVVAELLPRPDLVITSPHHRTLESARPTLARYPESLHEEWLVQEFTYLDAARYMNSTLHQRMPHAAAYWQRADPTYRDGTAESFAELVVRLDETRARLAALPHRFVVMFTHGLFTRAMLWRVLQGGDPVSGAWMGQAYKVIQGLRVPNAAIQPFYVTEGNEWLVGAMQTNHLHPHEYDPALARQYEATLERLVNEDKLTLEEAHRQAQTLMLAPAPTTALER